MMPTIRIEDDVFQALKSMAEAFVDTPNTVIRRLIAERNALSQAKLPVGNDSEFTAPAIGNKARANSVKPVVLTPQQTYEDFLLFLLATQFSGTAHKHEVTKSVLELMSLKGLIGVAELETVTTGETKAANTVAWGRNALKDRGLISKASQRGIWELTQEGMERGLQLGPKLGKS